MASFQRLWKIVLLLLLLAFALSFYFYWRTNRRAQAVKAQEIQLPQKPHKGRMAFAANVDSNWELFVMNGDGSELVRLTETSLDERSPAISPDGQQIAYSTSDGALWVMAIGTKAATPLPLSPNRYGYPSWLGDGSGIVYTAYKFMPGSEDADFFVYSLKDQTAQPFLTQTGPQDYAALSPENNRMAYITSLATVLPGFGSRITQQLWIASFNDGALFQLALGSESDTRPGWSPDGKWIAFSSSRKGTPDLWMIDADGQGLTQLTNSNAAETSPAWSPDGQEIAYLSTESGRMQLMILDMKTRASHALSPFGSQAVEVKDPCWR